MELHFNSWSPYFGSIIAKRWFLTEPQAIYDYQKELCLTPWEVWLIMHVLSIENYLNFPCNSSVLISKNTWESLKNVKKFEKDLIKKGYLVLIPSKWNILMIDLKLYNFIWLFRKLEEIIDYENMNIYSN
jgi:hypothetical protein